LLCAASNVELLLAAANLHPAVNVSCGAYFVLDGLLLIVCSLQERMHGIESKRRNCSVEETLAMFKEMQVGR
jgi:hypothetical protein